MKQTNIEKLKVDILELIEYNQHLFINGRAKDSLIDSIQSKQLQQESLEPNQTEADKESDWEQFIIDQINQSYNEHKGSNEAVQDAAYYITKKIESNLSIARKQVIEEIEEWRNNKRKSLGKINDEHKEKIGKMIVLDDLLTYLKTLKK